MTFRFNPNVHNITETRQAFLRIKLAISDLEDRTDFCANFTAVVDPTVDDDITLDFFPGCLWFNTVLDTFWIMEDNTEGAAVWTLLIGTGGVMEFDLVESHVTLLALDTANEITFSE